MHFREATLADIPQLMEIRFSVTENVLSDPALLPAEAYVLYLTERGKGWVCEAGPGQLLGFAIADVLGHNIWALFVRPGYEGQRIGQRLQQLMLDWYFSQTRETVWLGTAPGTRAETFYRRTGWRQTGLRANGEVGFEMTAQDWQRLTKA